MIELSYPLWFLALPLPLLIHRLLPAYRIRRLAVQVPFFAILADLLGETPSDGAVRLKPTRWQQGLLGFSWLMLVLAMTKPLWLGQIQTREMLGRDVMVVVDLSGSMATEDFTLPGGSPQSRLAAVKQVLAEFSRQRKGDRLGLVLFGDAAYLQAPFTADHQAWLALVEETDVAMAGQSTSLGDAIGLAIKVFEGNGAKEKVVMVLTDGNDTGSMVPPVDAAKIAADRQIRIHMVAIGDPTLVGEEALDMAVIEEVARLTGGEAFLALSPAELNRVSKRIAELEPEIYDSVSFRPKISIHYLPVLLAVLAYLLAFTLVTAGQWLQRRRVDG